MSIKKKKVISIVLVLSMIFSLMSNFSLASAKEISENNTNSETEIFNSTETQEDINLDELYTEEYTEEIESYFSDFNYITEFTDDFDPSMFLSDDEVDISSDIYHLDESEESEFKTDVIDDSNQAESLVIVSENHSINFTSKVAFPMSYVEDRSYYAYCIERGKKSPDSVSMSLAGTQKNKGVRFILANGLVNDSQQRNSRYLTGSNRNDYAITQYALWVYYGYINEYDNPFSPTETKGNATLLSKSKKLYADAVHYRDTGDDGVNVRVSPSSSTFAKEGGNFVSGWYQVTYNKGTMTDRRVRLDYAPSGTEIQYDGEEWFRLVIPVSKVKGNVSIDIGVRGIFNFDAGYMYSTTDNEYQRMLVPRKEILTIYAQNTATAILKATGGLQVYLTCEEFDPVTQQSKYTTRDAGGQQFYASGAEESHRGTTNYNGYKAWSDVLAGRYKVSEKNTPIQYRQPPPQYANVEIEGNAALYFKNTLKKGKVGFIKKCTYYGNVRVKGAVYGVYRSSDNALIERLTSDSDYVYMNKLLPYGFEGYLQEITPPKYYAPDETKYNFTITQDNQEIDLTAWNTPYSEVWPEFIIPNSDYRNSTDIIASYYIHNNSIAERRPNTGQGNVSPLTVDFTAKDNNGNIISRQTTDVNVPRFDKNLIYFKLKVPENTQGMTFTCTIREPRGVVETGNNHTAVNNFTVNKAPSSVTPDTKFENKPSNFVLPSVNASVPTGNLTRSVTDKASWQVWEWVNNSFTLKTYGLQLNLTNKITPDTAVKSQIKTQNSYEIKSGYGVAHQALCQMAARAGMIFSSDYYLPQHSNDYFPEYGYLFTNSKFISMDLTSNNLFELPKNEFATNSSGQKDYRRIHFLPLWFPDTNYVVKSYTYDAWTPAGMLSVQSTLSPISINGDAYDDWFINHQVQTD